MSKLGRKKLSLVQRQQVISAYIIGKSQKTIAADIHISPRSVATIIARYKQDTADQEDGKLRHELEDYKRQLKRLSITALVRALEDGSSTYQCGRIAIDVMRGIGEFAGDQLQVGVQVVLSPPGAMRADFVSSSDNRHYVNLDAKKDDKANEPNKIEP
jgi:hypothetical protein